MRGTERMSSADYRKMVGVDPDVNKEEKRSKYGSKKCVIDCIRFDSQAEGAYYLYLMAEKKYGSVRYFLRQVPISLPGGVTYRVDFQVFKRNPMVGDTVIPLSTEYVDVKGYETEVFKLKKKQVEALYPIKITCVTAKQIPTSYRAIARDISNAESK